MKLIIAGGRDYQFTADNIKKLDIAFNENHITEIVSGGAKGADFCGEQWAKSRAIKLSIFRADWDHYGKAAGHIRNEEMAKYADAVILFPGGKGTANMRQQAIKYKLKIIDLDKTQLDLL